MEKENDAGETIGYFYCNNRLKPPVVTNCKASVIARKGDSEEQLNEDDDDNIPEANWSIIRTNHSFGCYGKSCYRHLILILLSPFLDHI